jgi:DNA-binding PadR family transcriptional regulator
MSSPKRSLIALAVLAMLYEAPMHPYRMQRLIKQRGKDEVINVTQRAGLYQTIRDDKRPERTLYEITESGRAVALEWMRQILSTPATEYPAFPAAISFLPLLSPDDALRQFEARAKAIEIQLGRMDEGLKQAANVPRLFLLEYEYLRAAQVTELAWVHSVIEDLRAGRLTWSEAWLRQVAAQFSSDPTTSEE